MSAELAIYKQKRILELQTAYNSTVASLLSTLNANIRIVQNSRLLTTKAKQININNLNTQYNANVNNLKIALNKNIDSIQKFIPKPISINKNKKALLIGINYTGTSSELYGCINDTTLIKERISKNGFNSINIVTDLTSKRATRDNILEELKNLLINSQAGDLLFFLYSGHGSYTIDRNNDETDGRDELIIACDQKPILDDELKTLIQTNLKSGVTLFAMFDSCFSGTVLDLRYQYMDSLNYDNYTENGKVLDTLGNVFMISGCNDKQTSADSVFNDQANGAMTWSLLESLKQKPNCSWRELVKNMRALLKEYNYQQIPQFSSGTFADIDKQVFI
jgi:hypothetical protein